MVSTKVASITRNIREVRKIERWDWGVHDPYYISLMGSLDRLYPTFYLGDILTLLTDMGAFSLYKTEFFVDGTDGVPFLRVQNIQEYGVDLSKDTKYISKVYHEELKKSQLQIGDLLLTTKAVIGVSSVVDESLGECNMSQNLVRIRLQDDFNPHYVAVFLNSKLGRIQTETAATGPNQKYLNFERIKQLRIPIPPRPIQDRIAQIMQDAYAEQRAKLAEAQALLDGIDGFVFNQLNIHPESVVEATRFKKTISEILHGRFDVEYNMGFHKFDPYSDQVQPVQDVASFPSETRDPTQKPDIHFPYIDIASIDIHSGEIVETKTILGSEAPSRARQVVRASDIIVSTVRPTRGATALISDEMNNFICSTGFTIVRASDKVLPEYLHTALRLSTTLEQLGRRSSGSSHPAVLTKDIKQVLIPVPHKEVQEIIATEIMNRRKKASILKVESEHCIDTAKRQVERMILGKDASA